MSINIPPGVFDILPKNMKEAWRSSHIWQYVEEMIRQITRSYGYEEIRTPIFERTELFCRGVGETSDIVSKEMYTFQDKGDRSMTLRPEGTAPVIRSFVENQLYNASSVHKFYYIAPMFRYERAQAGRYRQHHQFGVEAIGNGSPEQDVEIIDLLYTFYSRLGLKNLGVFLNSIGDIPSRLAYKQALKEYLQNHYADLSADSKNRFETNPLRILDSKDAKDREIVANAPVLVDYLNEECVAHFEKVKQLLNLLKIPFQINHQLVRGLDYYTKTVFEVVAGELGAQNSIGGGGRFDGLIKTLGGPDLPTVGFGTGLERIIQTMLKQECPIPAYNTPTLFLVALDEMSTEVCFSLLHDIRAQGIHAQMDFSHKKLNKVMQYADQLKAVFVVIVGENELKNQEIEIKEMATGDKTKLPLARLTDFLQAYINENQLGKENPHV